MSTPADVRAMLEPICLDVEVYLAQTSTRDQMVSIPKAHARALLQTSRLYVATLEPACPHWGPVREPGTCQACAAEAAR